MTSFIRRSMVVHELKKPEVFGKPERPHLRWQCSGCGAKNVSALSLPVAKTEAKCCRRCRRLSAFILDDPSSPT